MQCLAGNKFAVDAATDVYNCASANTPAGLPANFMSDFVNMGNFTVSVCDMPDQALPDSNLALSYVDELFV